MTVEIVTKDVHKKSELNLAHFKENCHRYHDIVYDYEDNGTSNIDLECTDCGSHHVKATPIADDAVIE